MNNTDLDFFFKLQDKSKEEFKEFLSNYVFYRFEDDPIEEIVEEYKENNDKYSGLYQQISQNLPEEKRKLLLDLDFYIGSNLVISERIRYWQGFKDAYRLFAMLNS